MRARTRSSTRPASNIVAPVGATSYQVNHQAIEALPQGNNTTLDKVLLQLPGVTQDSAASGELHVRNEHANLQYRINGIMLPDGVGAFGQILDTGIVGSLALLTGALPAQYGLRTAGVLDIQTKADAFNNSGSVSVYGGSHGTITPSFEYGGTVGQTQYFVSGRYFCRTIWESKIRRRRMTRFTTAPRRKRDFSISRPCSIRPAA